MVIINLLSSQCSSVKIHSLQLASWCCCSPVQVEECFTREMPLIRLVPLVTIRLLLLTKLRLAPSVPYHNTILYHTVIEYIHSLLLHCYLDLFSSPRLFSLFSLPSLSASLVLHPLLVFRCSVDGQPVVLLTNSRNPPRRVMMRASL